MLLVVFVGPRLFQGQASAAQENSFDELDNGRHWRWSYPNYSVNIPAGGVCVWLIRWLDWKV